MVQVAFGGEKAWALPIFHALTGTDSVGNSQEYVNWSGFSNTWKQMYIIQLSRTLWSGTIHCRWTAYVCLLIKYCPKGVQITSIAAWFKTVHVLQTTCKKQPPTFGALDRRTHKAQKIDCGTKPLSCILSHYNLGHRLPVAACHNNGSSCTTGYNIVEMLRCMSVKTDCSTPRCSCQCNNLPYLFYLFIKALQHKFWRSVGHQVYSLLKMLSLGQYVVQNSVCAVWMVNVQMT